MIIRINPFTYLGKDIPDSAAVPRSKGFQWGTLRSRCSRTSFSSMARQKVIIFQSMDLAQFVRRPKSIEKMQEWNPRLK